MEKCSRLYVVTSPLIGMPKFFPRLHQAVVIQTPSCTTTTGGDTYKHLLLLLDVIPENPTSLGTLVTMVKGDSVPARPRCQTVSRLAAGAQLVGCVEDSQGDEVMNAAREFQEEYFSGPSGAQMGLYDKNCVHFCDKLVEHILASFPPHVP